MTRTLAAKPTGLLGRRSAASNFLAQGAALGAVSLASLAVARSGGAAVLGEYTLLRVLPWLVGVVFSGGLPVASSYHLGVRREDPALRSTLLVLAVAGSLVSVGVWSALAGALHEVLLRGVSHGLLLVMGVTVLTQLWTVWAKACCQGSADIVGANLIIVCEELTFLPAYACAHFAGLTGIDAVAVSMVCGGLAAAVIAAARLVKIGFFRNLSGPSPDLARAVLAFGFRGQLGNLLWLVNLRLDFIVLGVLAGPAALGVYAVATKAAELMRLPATALNYVLYPRFARQSPVQAAAEAARLLRRACLLTAAATPALAAGCWLFLPVVFGPSFRSAVVPACILLVGLSVEGAAAVGSAYLWGIGHPGANSLAMGTGVVLTVTFDILLIPSHGAVGAAVASTIAYLATTALLTLLTSTYARRLVPATDGAAENGATT